MCVFMCVCVCVCDRKEKGVREMGTKEREEVKAEEISIQVG